MSKALARLAAMLWVSVLVAVELIVLPESAIAVLLPMFAAPLAVKVPVTVRALFTDVVPVPAPKESAVALVPTLSEVTVELAKIFAVDFMPMMSELVAPFTWMPLPAVS